MNNSLKTVCENHNINFSSAKNVIQIYKKEGRLEKKVVRCRKNKKKDGSKYDLDLELPREPELIQKRTPAYTEKDSSCALMLLTDDDNNLVVKSRVKMS